MSLLVADCLMINKSFVETVVLKDTSSLELPHNITHHAPLRFRQRQITPEELLIYAGNF